MTEPAPGTHRPSVTLQDAGSYWITPNAPDRRLAATVLVPAFNAAATLERALASVRDQTLAELEIIVIDDASTDGTWEIIEAMLAAEPRLRAIRNKQNCGKPVSMNRAMGHARGRWLAVLDADDWYHLERLARLIALAEAAGAQMIADNQLFYDTIAARFVGTAWVVADRYRPLTLDTYLARSDAYARFSLGMLKPIFDAAFIRDRGVEYESDARNGQDFFKLLCFFLAGGTAVTTDIPYYCYTQPYGTSSRRWSHEARKRYNFQLAYTINQRYLTEQRDKLTPSQFALLERRSRQLRTLEHFHRLREAVARRDVRSTVSSVAAQPAVIAYCARQLWRRWRRVFVSATDATKATAGQLAVGSMDIASEPSQPVA
jgi:succinoglycan biosynthesis protein ExoO